MNWGVLRIEARAESCRTTLELAELGREQWEVVFFGLNFSISKVLAQKRGRKDSDYL